MRKLLPTYFPSLAASCTFHLAVVLPYKHLNSNNLWFDKYEGKIALRPTKIAQSRDHRCVYRHLHLPFKLRGGEGSQAPLSLSVRRSRSFTHRVLSLILTAAASLALDALPPQSLDSHRELWGELETGRVACK